jgi:hypothetical protein
MIPCYLVYDIIRKLASTCITNGSNKLSALAPPRFSQSGECNCWALPLISSD